MTEVEKYSSASQNVEQNKEISILTNTSKEDKTPQTGALEASVTHMSAKESLDSFEFDNRKIYSSTELENAGYVFGHISTNRTPTDLNIDKKVSSFKKSKGLITPCLIVKADICIAESLKVIAVDGTPITDPEVLKKTLVVIDGQHRHLAALKYNEEMENAGGPKLDCYFHFPLTEGVDIVTMLRESNVATTPWKGGDYITNLVSMKIDYDIDLSKIDWVKSHLGSCGDSAAWIWANFSDKIYSKSDMIKASKNDRILKDIAKLDKFEFGKALYEVACTKLGQKIVKLKVTPLTFVSIYDSESQNRSGEEVVNSLKDFINKIPSEEVEFIKKIKKKEYNGKIITKDSQIEDKLKELWIKYKDSHITEN